MVIIYAFHVLLSIFQIEMMSESIDETLDKDEAEEETEELTNQVQLTAWIFFSSYWGHCIPLPPLVYLILWFFLQVLDEIGVDIASQVSCFEILNYLACSFFFVLINVILTTVWFWYELTVIFSSKRPDCIKKCSKCCY